MAVQWGMTRVTEAAMRAGQAMRIDERDWGWWGCLQGGWKADLTPTTNHKSIRSSIHLVHGQPCVGCSRRLAAPPTSRSAIDGLWIRKIGPVQYFHRCTTSCLLSLVSVASSFHPERIYWQPSTAVMHAVLYVPTRPLSIWSNEHLYHFL
jgi:hypothetical protein